MRTLLLSLLLLVATSMTAQKPNFAEITGTNVNIRKAPASNGTLLAYRESEASVLLKWTNAVGKTWSAYHLPKGEIVQVVAKSNGWTKIRFRDVFTISDDPSLNMAWGYVEGWMSDQFVKPIAPINLTWDNAGIYLRKDWMVPVVCNGEQRVWVVDSYDGDLMLSWGRIENGHLVECGNDINTCYAAYDERTDGIAIEQVGDNCINVNFGKQYVHSDGFLIDLKKLSESEASLIMGMIPDVKNNDLYFFSPALDDTERNIRTYTIKK